MTTIDPAFFAAFPDLRSVEVSEQNEHFSSHNGMLFDEGLTNLLLVPEGMEGVAVLPDTLATVPACVLSRCTKLSAIVSTDPSGSIGGIFTAWNGILYNADKTELLAAPAGLGASASIALECERIAEGAFLGNEGLRTITSGDGVSGIAAGAEVDGAAALPAFEPEVVQAATVLTGNRSAWEAAGFTSFAEPAQPGDTAAPAEGESGLAYTLLESGQLVVAWVGDGAAPAKVDIPSTAELNGATYTVAALAEGAFKDQTALEEITMPATVSVIGSSAFENCSALRAVSIPGSVADIPARAFAGCTALENIALAEGVRTIGQAAFEGTAAAEIEIPASISAVEANAFADMPNLKSVFCAGDVSKVDNATLAGDSSINIYTPQNQSDSYPWSVGLAASGNHLRPYGAISAQEVIRLGLGQTVDLFEHVSITAPEGMDIAYSYNAKTLSVDSATHTATAKGYGRATVNVRVLYKDAVVATASADVVVENTDQTAADAEDGSSDEGDESEGGMPFVSDAQEGGAEVTDPESQGTSLAVSGGEPAQAVEGGETPALSDDEEAGESISPESPMTSSALNAPTGKGLGRMFNVLGIQSVASPQASMPSARAGMTFTISTHVASGSSGIIASTSSSIGSYMGPLASAGSFTVSATLKSGLTASKYNFEWTASIDGQSAGSFVGISNKNSLNATVGLPAGCGGNITLTISATSRYSSITAVVNTIGGITAASVTPTEYENNKSTATTVKLSATQAAGDSGTVSWRCSPTGAASISGSTATIPARSSGNISFTPTKLYSISASASTGAATAGVNVGSYPHMATGASTGASVSVNLTATAKPGYKGDPTWRCNASGVTISGNTATIPAGTNKNLTFTATYTSKVSYTISGNKGTGADTVTVSLSSYQVSTSNQTVTLSATAATGYTGSPKWKCSVTDTTKVVINNNDTSNATATIKAGTVGDLTFTPTYEKAWYTLSAGNGAGAKDAMVGIERYQLSSSDQTIELSATPETGSKGYPTWVCVVGNMIVSSTKVSFTNNGSSNNVTATIKANTTGNLTFVASYSTHIIVTKGVNANDALTRVTVARDGKTEYSPTSGSQDLNLMAYPGDGYEGYPVWSCVFTATGRDAIASGDVVVTNNGLANVSAKIAGRAAGGLTFTATYSSKESYKLSGTKGTGAGSASVSPETYQISSSDQTVTLSSTAAVGYTGSPTWKCSVTDTNKVTISGGTAIIKAGTTGAITFTADYSGKTTYNLSASNGAGSIGAAAKIGAAATYQVSGSDQTVTLTASAAEGYKGTARWTCSVTDENKVRINSNGTATIKAGTTGNLTFTANYSPIEYYVFFDRNGATEGFPPRELNAVYDQDFIIDFNGNEELSKRGYVFDGWALSPDGEKVCGKYAGRNLTTEDGESVCLYAHFTPLTTSVEWRDPEGIITSSPVSSAVIFTFGEQIPDISDIYTEPTATRVGYRFDGWWYNAQQHYDAKGNRTCTDIWPQSPSIPTRITLEAKWTPVRFTLDYAAGSAGSGSQSSDSFTYKTGGLLPGSSFTTDASHQFDGWLVTFGGVSKKYLAGASIDGIIEGLGITDGATVTATAQWAEKTVTQVTINWHDGSGASPVATTPNVGDAIMPPANPVKDGSVFMGWGVAGSSAPVDFTGLKATVDADYYAIWDQPWFTISFRGDGTRYAAQLKQFDWVDDAASIKMADRYANKVFGVNGDYSTLHMWVKYGEADAFILPEVLNLFELAGATPDPQWLMGAVPLSGGAVIGSGQPGAPSFETLYGGASFHGSTGAQLKACFNPALALTVPVRADIQLNADDAADAQNNGCDLRFTSGSIAPIGIAGLEERSSAADKEQFDARMKQVLSEPDFTNAYLQIADTGDTAKGYKLMLAGRTGTLLDEAKPLVLDAGVGKTLTARYSLKGYDPAHLSVSTNMKVANLTFTYQIEE